MTRVSIVICTYNRAESLRETIRCLRYQRYDQFEVIVVNGPSTDHTAEVLGEFDGLIRAEVCPLPNLSVSRNIGIRAAAGDIVAFIDDDALPEFEWLQQALPALADETVGGVGGIVFDHSGMALQYRYSAANRFGETTSSVERPYDDFSVPGSFLFPYLQGTNALFRRSALEEIGGFDEVYDYYLDETDVCCRLVDAGYVLRQLHHAPVHHKFLPSSIRTPERVVTNWFPIIKNQTYFAFRHALGARPEIEVIERCRANIDRWCADAKFHQEGGRLPAETVERVVEIGAEAVRRGMELGRERQWTRLRRMAPPTATFRRFPTIDSSRRRCIAMVTGDYPPRSTGGIARFLGDAAPALAARGHEVRVITRTEHEHGAVDLEDGVWVHRVETPPVATGEGAAPEALPHIDAFVTASAAELQRIGTWRAIDVAYGPAWDVDVIAALRTTPVPVVTMLATPVAVAARHAGELDDPQAAANLAGLMRAERDLFTGAHLLHSISGAVLETVEHEYDLKVERERAAVAAIGLRDHRPEKATKRPAGPVRVLFVGRLETRKGIDDLLAAIETVAPRHDDVEWQIAGAETRPKGQPSHESLFRHCNRTATWLRRVSFLGGVDDDTLHELYERADLVVLPSRYESFGLVMVEAMMHARAQVSCSIGGIEEVVRHNVDGLLVAPADPAALAAAIDDLLTDPQRRRAMGRAGRTRYEKHFTIDAAAARLDLLLARVTFARVGHSGVTAIDPGPRLVASGGHEALWMERRTRVVIAPAAAPGMHRTASIDASEGAQVVLRNRASLARTVDLREGWNSVPLPSIADDTVITWRSGDVIFGGLVSVAGPE